jgi:hypothetical protein
MFFYILLLILFLIYASLYYIFNKEVSIYQTNTAHFTFDLLFKKQPIIIDDNIDIKKIINDWFSYNLIYENITYTENWNHNNYKYLLIYSNDNTEILLCNPKCSTTNNFPNENAEPSLIRLNNKLLIIPFKWYYHINNNNIIIYGIHDYITYFLSKI